MADVLTSKQRRLNMSRIRSRDTKPEMILRRGMHALGLRFRVCREDLPGSPDLSVLKTPCGSSGAWLFLARPQLSNVQMACDAAGFLEK